MGRRNSVPSDRFTIAPKLRLVRLRWVSGDYDQGGAYWGNSGGTFIYQARGENPLAGYGTCPKCGNHSTNTTCPKCVIRQTPLVQPQDEICEVFVRAANRTAAKAAVREFFPKASFHN